MNKSNKELNKTQQIRELQAQKEAEDRKKKEEEKIARRKKLMMAAKLVAAAAVVAALIAVMKKVREKNKENRSKEADAEAIIVQSKLEELLNDLNGLSSKAKSGKMTNAEYDDAMDKLSLARRYQQTIPSICKKKFGSDSVEYKTIDEKLKPKTKKLDEIRKQISDDFVPAGKKKNMSKNVLDNVSQKREEYKDLRKTAKEKKDRYGKTTSRGNRIKNYMTYDLKHLHQDRKNGTFYDKNSVDDTLLNDLFNDDLISIMSESQMDFYIDCWDMLIQEAENDMHELYDCITDVVTEKVANDIISIDKGLEIIESASKMYLD